MPTSSRLYSFIRLFGLLIAVSLLTSGCAGSLTLQSNVQKKEPLDTETKTDETPKTPKEPSEEPTTPVCDPFESLQGLETGERNGLLGKLSYLNAGDPIAESVFNFWNIHEETGTVTAVNGLDVDLFFRWVNVPTRSFDSGFFTVEGGEPLKRADGEILVENFSVYYESNLVLGEAAPGRYEIAILSDDGAVLKIYGAGEAGTDYLNDNDGTHPTRMSCSNTAIDLNADSQFPLELFYHQGPRYHIALILMWRKLQPGENPGQDAHCGHQSNNDWFDYSSLPATPKQHYLDLLARGWEVIPTTSFLLPDDRTNPCVE